MHPGEAHCSLRWGSVAVTFFVDGCQLAAIYFDFLLFLASHFRFVLLHAGVIMVVLKLLIFLNLLFWNILGLVYLFRATDL